MQWKDLLYNKLNFEEHIRHKIDIRFLFFQIFFKRVINLSYELTTLISNSPLFVIGNSKFYLRHFLIIGILAISFSLSFMIRAQAGDYGFELNEFDPFFNFRATEFLVQNGFEEYFNWNDDRSWHTIGGRDVSATSQVMLHITAAILYQIFGFGSSLYDFTIVFPLIFGSLTTIMIFAMVRVLGGTTAGLFASLFFAVSIPIILRGMIGWFKSEPLGIFYALLGMYLFLSGIKSRNKKIALLKIIGGGIFLSFGFSSWGGIQFFLLPLGLFFITLPFLRKDSSFIFWAIPLFTSSLMLTSLVFERPGINFVFGLGGMTIIVPTIMMMIIIIIKKYGKDSHKTRNGFVFLIISLMFVSFLLILNPVNDDGSTLLPLPSFRYLNAINPFLITSDPLVDSVAEHATLTIQNAFRSSLILMIFAGIGIWLLFRNKEKVNNSLIENDMIAFTLIMSILGVYVTSAFVRLELFGSISLIVLSSIGLSIMTKGIFSKKLNIEQLSKKNKKFKKLNYDSIKQITKFSYVVIIIVLLLIPLTLPQEKNWINVVKGPPTILNGGTIFNLANQDWPDAMMWLKNNTHQDAVVVSWWDYGYWITTMGERVSLADNATLDTEVIQSIAKMFLSTPDDAWNTLKEMDGDYVLIFIGAEKIQVQDERSLYLLKGGGDEGKKQWFIRIAEEPLSKYVASDGFSGTDLFWDDTLLGKMFPFTPLAYINPNNPLQQSTSYIPGFIAIYEKINKFPIDGDGPLRLVYESDSLKRTTPGAITGIIIYEINKDYKPLLEP